MAGVGEPSQDTVRGYPSDAMREAQIWLEESMRSAIGRLRRGRVIMASYVTGEAV